MLKYEPERIKNGNLYYAKKLLGKENSKIQKVKDGPSP